MRTIVAKFGGTSLADAGQFRKIREIVDSDPDRRFIVASAPGKRFPKDIKIIDGEPLRFTAATQNYDFVYVTDVAKAFYLIAKNGKPFCEYMIGSGNARPLKEFIIEMQQALAPDAVPLFGDVPFTGTNMPLSVFGTEETEKDTGFKAEIGFAEGTRRTMEWLKTLREGGSDGTKI